MFIPYKAKIPITRFPYVTVALIAANGLAFFLTGDDVLDKYALRSGADSSPLITHLTSMFLHDDVFHLLGNMVFLWVFGQAVEDRLGPVLYLGLYLLSGLTGHLAQGVLGATAPISVTVREYGASGCIAGVLGAYWYLYAWSRVRILYCVAWFWQGTFEVAAIWVIGWYFVMDLFWGLADRLSGAHGVAHFAHLGGTCVAALVLWGFRFKRDSRNESIVKANIADCGGDRSLMNYSELRILVEQSRDDDDLLVDYAKAAMLDEAPDDLRLALAKNPMAVITKCPEAALHYLLTLKGNPSALPAAALLHLAMRCEKHNQALSALQVYDIVAAQATDSHSEELALYRSAGLSWRQFRDGAAALEKLDALLARFPRGAFVLEAEDLRDEIRGRGELAA